MFVFGISDQWRSLLCMDTNMEIAMIRLFLALFVLVAAVFPQEGKASAYMFNDKTHKCLDFAVGDPNNLSLQQWDCGGPYAHNQQWDWVFIVGYKGDAFVFQNVATGTCIGVENNSLQNAARLVQQPCNTANPSQHWIRATRDPYYENKTKWINGRSGKCMDAWNNINGPHFQQYDCAGTSYWAPQMFDARFEAIGQDY
jgi:hypothetical protein